MRPFAISVLALLLPCCVDGQRPVQYRAAQDTLKFESVNSYHLFFVRGVDTLGEPMKTRTIEMQHFTQRHSVLAVSVRLQSAGGQPFSREDTYTVTSTGRVLTVAGQAVAQVPHARVDLLPRLPDRPTGLEVGFKWTDTVSVHALLPYGPTYYAARREYRVQRIVDSLCTQLAHIVGEGVIRLRQGDWQDSVRRIVWWQEVVGPVVDTVWFDVRGSRLIGDVTSMDLVGTGGSGLTNSGSAMPSGLRSVVRRRSIPARGPTAGDSGRSCLTAP
jgi:hypothetical protein